MAICFVCQPNEVLHDPEMLDHLRVVHPEVWGDGPQRWPDGRIVVYDTTLTPGDFGRPARPQPREACAFCLTGLAEHCPWHRS
jgi:hypothetical protein